MTDEQLVYICVASMYEPTADTPADVTEKMISDVIKPLVKEILDSDKNTYDECYGIKDVDHEKQGFWKNRSKILLGHNMDSVLNVMKKYDVDISEDDYLDMRAYGSIMQKIHSIQSIEEDKFLNPFYKLISSDADLSQKALQLKNIIHNADNKDFLNRYSDNILGFTVEEPGILDKKITKKQVYDSIGEVFEAMKIPEEMDLGNDPDFDDIYNTARQNAKTDDAGLFSEGRLSKEKERMKELGLCKEDNEVDDTEAEEFQEECQCLRDFSGFSTKNRL